MSPERLRLTDAEFAVLEALWQAAPRTIRQITATLYPAQTTSDYATVQKLLERLEAKGAVRRDRSQTAHQFSAAVAREALIDDELAELADRLCGGSLTPVLNQLVRNLRPSKAEREQLRKLIDQHKPAARRKAMTVWLLAGLSNAVTASVLALVVWLATRFVRNAQVVALLWLLVLVKLVSPPVFNLPLARLPWERWGEQVAQLVERPAPLPRETPDQPIGAYALRLREEPAIAWPAMTADEALLLAGDHWQAGDNWRAGDDWQHGDNWQAGKPAALEASVPAAPPAVARQRPTIDWSAAARWLAGTWLAGSAIWLTLAAHRLWRFRRLVARAAPAPARVRNEVARLAAQLRLQRPPTVRVVDRRVGPLVWGLVGQPTILLPARLLTSLSDQQLVTLLAHELVHLARRDHLVRWLELAAIGLYWWHPLAWWARRELERAEEQCCDARVVALLPEATRAYAEAMLQTIEFLSDSSRPLPLGASGFSQLPFLRRRLEMVLAGTPMRRVSWPARLVLLAVGVAVLPMSLAALWADPPAKPAATIQPQSDPGQFEAIEQASDGQDAPAADENQKTFERNFSGGYSTLRNFAFRGPAADDPQPADGTASDWANRVIPPVRMYSRVGSAYLVEVGDTLKIAAKKIYGDEAFDAALAEHNRERLSKDAALVAGQLLLAPPPSELARLYPNLVPTQPTDKPAEPARPAYTDMEKRLDRLEKMIEALTTQLSGNALGARAPMYATPVYAPSPALADKSIVIDKVAPPGYRWVQSEVPREIVDSIELPDGKFERQSRVVFETVEMLMPNSSPAIPLAAPLYTLPAKADLPGLPYIPNQEIPAGYRMVEYAIMREETRSTRVAKPDGTMEPQTYKIHVPDKALRLIPDEVASENANAVPSPRNQAQPEAAAPDARQPSTFGWEDVSKSKMIVELQIRNQLEQVDRLRELRAAETKRLKAADDQWTAVISAYQHGTVAINDLFHAQQARLEGAIRFRDVTLELLRVTSNDEVATAQNELQLYQLTFATGAKILEETRHVTTDLKPTQLDKIAVKMEPLEELVNRLARQLQEAQTRVNQLKRSHSAAR